MGLKDKAAAVKWIHNLENANEKKNLKIYIKSSMTVESFNRQISKLQRLWQIKRKGFMI